MFRVFNLKTEKVSFFATYQDLRNMVQRDFCDLCRYKLDNWIADRSSESLVMHNHIIKICRNKKG